MEARLKLKPGQKGTKKLLEKYGDSLVCVRYRYDRTSRIRLKTVEIIIETKDWTPPPPKFNPNELVPVRIAYTENSLIQIAKAAGGRWNPTKKLWFIPYGNIKSTILEKHILLDALDK